MNEDLAAAAGRQDISGRKWIAVFAGFLAVCGLLYILTQTVPQLTRYEVLVLLLLYTSIAFTFCPLPTAWIMLWAAREIDPLSVALVGAVGTCIANLHDYYIFNFLLSLEKVRKVKETGFYHSAVKWFGKAPFLTLTAASFLPIPIDVVRMLAVSTGYPRRRYLLATFAGRFPRYLLLAWLGYELKLSNKAIFVVFLATALIGIVKGISKMREKYAAEKSKDSAAHTG